MSEIDSTKKVHLIVHGQRQLLEPVKDKLAGRFKRENMQPASLDKAGEAGEYVAMLWPPMAAKEIVVSQITGTGGSGSGGGGRGMGAWGSVSQKELFRVPL
ncbi:hypothetical protein Ngar_c35370 [Candidatus Nitrososphaera gargensis Ga9.2]|uniref:Uncharacterized protein n=1 Tax=Nitrososphaera gargensis (strain Ga9.2) TaxID=1237085 RepID=K0IK01_NITGG|nr:hypothetical protein [Candidatus Nitrososphaera gargensis]AFU60450.1 hypothetical protein Ngar_c35370 [Candidatus Nitrososphaera gargensis Ga9.2]